MESDLIFWEKYLSAVSTDQRLAVLHEAQTAQISMPISLASDILLLGLSSAENQAILECVDYSQDSLDYEAFLLDDIALWDQDLAVKALLLWSKNSENILWHRVLLMLCSPFSSQRVKYTIVSLAHHLDGELVLKALEAQEGTLRDFSPAFHALIFEKTIAYHYSSRVFEDLALWVIDAAKKQSLPENKALLPAIMSLAILNPGALKNINNAKSSNWLYWGSIIDSLLLSFTPKKIASKASKNTPSTRSKKGSDKSWPELHNRSSLNSSTVINLLHQQINLEGFDQKKLFEHFAGFSPQIIIELFDKRHEIGVPQKNLVPLLAFLPFKEKEKLVNELSGEEHGKLTLSMPVMRGTLRSALWRLEGSPNPHWPAHWNGLVTEQEKVVSYFISQEKTIPPIEPLLQTFKYQTEPLHFMLLKQNNAQRERSLFLAEAFRSYSEMTETTFAPTFWGLLRKNWHSRELLDLDELVKEARSQPFLWQFLYVKVLGKFSFDERAVLKILDFVRTDSLEMQKTVVQSLASNGTGRALQELAHLLTRPGSPMSLRLDAAHALKNHDLSQIQDELIATLNDLTSQHWETGFSREAFEEQRDLVELVETLIVPKQYPINAIGQKGTTTVEKISIDPNMHVNAARIDGVLIKKLPHYKELSSEVKRALRTAQFFHEQVTEASDMSAIDLSPLVDMQYKALELLFRELFEEPLKQLLGTGIVQRKLDQLGYARPIPRLMDEFEGFISQMDIIKTIPFFSKFKMRKLLRSLCQFTPDRRFTFDGLKAFGIFFICFGRSKCPYGLTKIVTLGLSETALQDFAKNLHVVQDIRNRAAHEGFHPEAKANIDKIWLYTAEIIQVAFEVYSGAAFSENLGNHHSRKPQFNHKHPGYGSKAS